MLISTKYLVTVFRNKVVKEIANEDRDNMKYRENFPEITQEVTDF